MLARSRRPTAGVRRACDRQGVTAIEPDALQRALSAAEPSAVLVSPRMLRRLIRRHLGLRYFGGAVARQTAYALPGPAAAQEVGRQELRLDPARPWPETVYLVLRPEPDQQAPSPLEALLRTAWRRLYRARVREEVRRRLAGADDGPGAIAARVGAIGRTEFEEARSVLTKDGYVLAADPDVEVYAAFAAVFLELTAFDVPLRKVTFPAVENPAEVGAVFGSDVDAVALLAATRPEGAPGPSPSDGWPEDVGDRHGADEDSRPYNRTDLDREPDRAGRGPVRERDRRLARQARALAEKGNNVRAARLWSQVSRDERDGDDEARAAARAQLKQLANRLQKALFVRKGEAELWADALTPLLRHAAWGFWGPEARMLYDLQNVCLDLERKVYRLEPLGWLLTGGRRPLLRPLPQLREVSMTHHLRRAARRVAKVRVTHEERARLYGLLDAAVHRAGEALRDRFRPRVGEALAEAHIRPRGVVERVAYRKLVEEILDPVVARGFSTLGDLRDAVSRSQLKMPDLAGPGEFFRGDRLLAADRALARRLDGVHRRGEVYLRWLQRFSALAFGTRVGRALTLFVALPFGGAFVALKGLEEVDELVTSHLTGLHLHLVNPRSVVLLGLVALGWINFARFREGLRAAAGRLGWCARCVLVDLPARVLTNPVVLRALGSRAARAAWRWGVKPGLAAGLFGGWALAAGATPGAAGAVAGVMFLAAVVTFNTAAGRELEDLFAESLGRSVRALVLDVIPGLFRLILAWFEDLLDWVEKVIYAVDEWLRFRSGQSALMLGVKAVLGTVWAVLAYLIRIYVNLLIEPQVNPIKHFPVVTVSAKVIIPLSFQLTRVFGAVLTPFLGQRLGMLVAGANVFLLPGVFGFLVWELKSNWRLYEANRPAHLGPVVVGGHGETFVGLLRPGFHSGTVPKQYARLRRARRAGRDRSALKRRDALHHVEEAVRRFVERDFCALLGESRALGGAGVRPGSIRLATNRVRVEFLGDAFDGPPVVLDLEERCGVLVVGLSGPGWLPVLDDEARPALGAALLGLAKLTGAGRIQPPGKPVSTAPRLAILLSDVPVGWSAWIEAWDEERRGPADARPFRGWPPVLEVAGASAPGTAEGLSRPG